MTSYRKYSDLFLTKQTQGRFFVCIELQRMPFVRSPSKSNDSLLSKKNSPLSTLHSQLFCIFVG